MAFGYNFFLHMPLLIAICLINNDSKILIFYTIKVASKLLSAFNAFPTGHISLALCAKF